MQSTRVINLMRGWPNPSLLPANLLQTAATDILSNPDTFIPALQYAPDEGPVLLRNALSEYLSKFYHRDIHTDRICTSGGASQNLAVALAVFTDPAYTRAAWIVEPTYYLACRIFEDAGLTCKPVPSIKECTFLDVSTLADHIKRVEKERNELVQRGIPDAPKYKPYSKAWPTKLYKHVIYCVPTFSNPAGKIMTLEERCSLVRLAREIDALIICDDVYDFLYWSSNGERPSSCKAIIPRLVDVDALIDGGAERDDAHGFGNVLSNGSFSKIVGPGVRTGWAEGTRKLAFALSQAGTNRSGGAASNLTGEMIACALSSGALQNHILNTLIFAYQKRWQLLKKGIDENLVPLGANIETPIPHSKILGNKENSKKYGFGTAEDESLWLDQFRRNDFPSSSSFPLVGGFFIYVKLPKGISADILARNAQQTENLIISPESIFLVNARPHLNTESEREHIRLCLAWEDEEALSESMIRLAKVLQALLEDRNHAGISGPLHAAGKSWENFK